MTCPRPVGAALAWCLAALCGPACDASRVVVTTYEDEGHACLVPEGADLGGGELLAGAPAVVRVVFDECASLCAKVEHASCDATREGTGIAVTGVARVREVQEESGGCGGACLPVLADCNVGTLEGGTYAITFGQETRDVEVPGTDWCFSWAVGAPPSARR